jgi:hypothetical protein
MVGCSFAKTYMGGGRRLFQAVEGPQVGKGHGEGEEAILVFAGMTRGERVDARLG